jgi:hypothetical protein
LILTSIRIPSELIDKRAEINGKMGNLSNDSTGMVIKTPFIQKKKSSYY